MTESASEAWARCRPWIEGAIQRSDSPSIEEVEARILAGRAFFCPGDHAAVIYELTKDAHCWLAGGNLAEILQKHRLAEAWARDNGCERMTLRGRPGWARVLKPLGYEPVTILAKEL